MASAFVQANSVDTTGTSAAITLTSVGAAHLIHVGVRFGAGLGSTITVSDNQNAGNYTQIEFLANNLDGDTTGTYFMANTAAATTQITIAVSSSATIRANALEFSGLATSNPLDQHTSNDVASQPSPATSGATGTRTQAAEMLVGFCSQQQAETWTAGTGFTIPTNGSVSKAASEYQNVSSVGTDAATFAYTLSGNAWTAIATFKDAGAATAVPMPRPPRQSIQQAINRATSFFRRRGFAWQG